MWLFAEERLPVAVLRSTRHRHSRRYALSLRSSSTERRHNGIKQYRFLSACHPSFPFHPLHISSFARPPFAYTEYSTHPKLLSKAGISTPSCHHRAVPACLSGRTRCRQNNSSRSAGLGSSSHNRMPPMLRLWRSAHSLLPIHKPWHDCNGGTGTYIASDWYTSS